MGFCLALAWLVLILLSLSLDLLTGVDRPLLQYKRINSNTMETQIVSSIITGSSTVLATILGSITALLVGRKIAMRQELREDLKRAVHDIHFLMAVEEEHCERNKSGGGESFKLRTRTAAREKTGLDFSGRFTPGNWKETE